MTIEREHEIQQTAYYLWEAEGRPEGRALDHWLAAVGMVDEQRRGGAAKQPLGVKGESDPPAAPPRGRTKGQRRKAS